MGTTGEAGAVAVCDGVARGMKARPHAEIGWGWHVNRAGSSLKFHIIAKLILIVETSNIKT